MGTRATGLAAAVIVSCSVSLLATAARANTVVYDFTGTVTTASGIYSSAGSTVTGTFTINFAAADTPQGSIQGTIGSTSAFWQAQVLGGSAFGAATPSEEVFTSTLTSGGVSYGPVAPSSVDSQSLVAGLPPAVTAGEYVWDGLEIEYANSNSYTESSLEFNGKVGGAATFDSNGLPILGNVVAQSDGLYTASNGVTTGELLYNITSLTPVPLPASLWLLLSAFGGLGFALSRRVAVEALNVSHSPPSFKPRA